METGIDASSGGGAGPAALTLVAASRTESTVSDLRNSYPRLLLTGANQKIAVV